MNLKITIPATKQANPSRKEKLELASLLYTIAVVNPPNKAFMISHEYKK